jgi:hypothetical protein
MQKFCEILRRKNNMYINPFWAGVLTTIFAEVGGLFVASVIAVIKRGKRRDN